MHIYKWTHTESNRCYIGQSIQAPNQRRLEHINDSKHCKKTYHFHNALRRYGVEAFTWEVIDTTATSLDELNNLEEKYVEMYDSINNGFNIRQPGKNKLHSEESKKRMSEAQKSAHARRRAEGRDTWTRQDGGCMKGKKHPGKGKEHKKWDNKGTMGWKVVNGIRVWYKKEAVV
jgi:group I intron endonuclease